MKISVVTASYTITGVPLAQLRFARALARAGHDVELLYGSVSDDGTVDGQAGPPPVEGVRTVVLGQKRARALIRPLRRYLKDRQPDIVFSAEDHLNGAVLVAAILARSKAKISGSSRVSPFDSYSNRFPTRKWWAKQAMRAIMWRADALTCVSRDMVAEYHTIFPGSKHASAYNIINDEESRCAMREPVDHSWFADHDVPIIVSAGTLTRRKNFPLLVDAVRLLHHRGIAVRLAIFGEGHQRSLLERMTVDFGISDHVWLPGRTANPLRYFARADIIALTSRAEGLPNVLIEGMIAGCVPVAVDCPTGPREVLGGGDIGYLVPNNNATALADALEQALSSPDQTEARKRIIDQFTPLAVIARHFELLSIAQG